MPLKNDRGQLLDKERVSWDEKNDGSFAQKRRVVFIKTTGHFYKNDGSFFLNRRVAFQRASAREK